MGSSPTFWSVQIRSGRDETWSHGQITRESPADTGEIPDRALSLERPSVVRNGAVHRGATGGTNREGHRGLAGRRIIGGKRRMAQEDEHCHLQQVIPRRFSFLPWT